MYWVKRYASARVPMFLTRGRLLYSSAVRAISASRRAISSALFARSWPLKLGSATSVGASRGSLAAGLGVGAIFFVLLACVSKRFCRTSSSCTRFFARSRSLPCCCLAETGKGVVARRSASVLPPASTLACASTCALSGFRADLLLTKTTSSPLSLAEVFSFSATKFVTNSAPCSKVERSKAAPNSEM